MPLNIHNWLCMQKRFKMNQLLFRNDGKHLCHPCHGRNCDLRIANCPYGDVKNDCDEYVCAKVNVTLN